MTGNQDSGASAQDTAEHVRHHGYLQRIDSTVLCRLCIASEKIDLISEDRTFHDEGYDQHDNNKNEQRIRDSCDASVCDFLERITHSVDRRAAGNPVGETFV